MFELLGFWETSRQKTFLDPATMKPTFKEQKTGRGCAVFRDDGGRVLQTDLQKVELQTLRSTYPDLEKTCP